MKFFYLSKEKSNDPTCCVNCGEVLLGEYCYKCGEKKLDKEDHAVKKFFEQGIYIFTHFDSKIWKSIYLLATKPGYLTSEYLKGRRVQYAKPLQLFFIINVVYFLSYIGFDTFTTPVNEHMIHTFYSGLATKMVNEKIMEENITMEKYDEKFYHTITLQSKLLIVIMIFMLALLFQLLYFRQGFYYYDNLVFSTYFFSFILLYLTFILNLLDFIFYFLLNYKFNFDTHLSMTDPISYIIFTVSIFIYLYFALKRVYKQPVQITLLKTVLSIIGLYTIIEIYRFILFFTVYYTT